MVYRILNVSRNVSNVIKEWPTLAIWLKQLILFSKTNSFQEWIFGQANWACLSHRSLEGGTRVQQIIIGYFVAPISICIFEITNMFDANNKIILNLFELLAILLY